MPDRSPDDDEPIEIRTIERIDHKGRQSLDDEIAVESPMQTNVIWTKRGREIRRPVAVTMRTPGRDEDLAIGFLIGEGVIDDLATLDSVTRGPNQVDVRFRDGVVVELCDLHRRGTTTSACGVCGKTTLEQIRVKSRTPVIADQPTVDSDWLCQLPQRLRDHQSIFARTGGLHGCGLFHPDAGVVATAEDVGRHNALDKLVGDVARRCPEHFAQSVLVLSGRISFELVQKSVVVGIGCIVAVGAPSSLAIQTAEAFGQTVVGFTSANRMNIYCGGHRILDRSTQERSAKGRSTKAH